MFEDEEELQDDIGREQRKQKEQDTLAPLQVSFCSSSFIHSLIFQVL